MGQQHEGPVLTPPTGQPATGQPTTEDLGSAIPAQRTAPAEPGPQEPASPPDTPPGVRMCTCGHPEDMHEHYRSGSDCGACGSSVCPSFRATDEPPGLLRRLLRKR